MKYRRMSVDSFRRLEAEIAHAPYLQIKNKLT